MIEVIIEPNNEDVGTKDRILDAAVDLFGRNGYGGTSVREITAQAGVTKPVLYYYFGSKEGLFRAIFEKMALRQQAIANKVLARTGTISERLKYFSFLLNEEVAAHNGLTQMLKGVFAGIHDPPPCCDFKRLNEFMFETVRTIYNEGLLNNEVAAVESQTVSRLLSLIVSAPFILDFFGVDPAPEGQADIMWDILFSGLALKEN